MTYSKKLWMQLGAIFILSFAVLGLIGREIYVKAPPVPDRVVSTSGATLYTMADIENGREVWQTLGGLELGSIWGHGGQVAPDWGTDWLHREATTMLDIWAREGGAKDFAALDGERQAALKERLKRDLRTNRYDAKLDTITVSNVRARAMGVTAAHYAALFSTDSALEELRVQYAIPKRSLIDTEQRRQLGAFFFWIAWTSVTERRNHLYHNWPHEPLVGNTPSASLGMWSIASVLFLIAGIGWPLWYQRRRGDEAHAAVPAADPFLTMKPTPSMRRRPNIRHRHRDVARAILLFTGLMIWLTLVGRALWPALRTRNETRGLIAMVFIC